MRFARHNNGESCGETNATQQFTSPKICSDIGSRRERESTGVQMTSGQVELDWAHGRRALEELLRSRVYAERAAQDTWQFAVEITTLNQLGLSNSDLRMLVLEGRLRHAHEVSRAESPQREFSQFDSHQLTVASCFTLTDLGVSFVRQLESSAFQLADKPTWNIDRRELWLGQFLIKRFRCPALNQETILSVFQEEGWPERIDDPLPQLAGREPKRRLHDTTKNLNKNQVSPLLRFRGDGTGQGIIWQRATSGKPVVKRTQ